MIRPLTTADLDAFMAIRLDSLKLNPEAFGAAFEEGLEREQTCISLSKKNEEDFILGYFEENQLKGIIGFMRESRQKKRHKAFVWGVFVYPDCRHKGIGQQLMQACLQRAEKLEGLEQINLSVTNRAGQARQLYERLGFQVWGTEVKSLKVKGEYLDEIHMVKML